VIDQNFRRVAVAPAKEYERGIELLTEKYRLNRAALSDAMNWAGMVYDGEACWAGTEGDRTAPDALDKLAKALNRVIYLLYPRYKFTEPANAVDRNFHRLVSALADPNRKAGWPRELSEEAAWPEEVGEISGELDRLITRLESIRRVAGEVHIAPRRGRKPKTRDLRAAVRYLAGFWESLGRRFTIDWEKRQPVSEAAQFVYDAMTLITKPERLSQLKKVTEYVRDERNPKLRSKAPR
jgi:hypothetical protein